MKQTVRITFSAIM